MDLKKQESESSIEQTILIEDWDGILYFFPLTKERWSMKWETLCFCILFEAPASSLIK
jgi:hypothetical protein